VPADWVAASVSPEAPHLQPGDNPASSWTFGYGYKWWIPENPQGDFTAIGVWGQYILIDIEREVIIVKTSADPDFDDNDHKSVAAFRGIADGSRERVAACPATSRVHTRIQPRLAPMGLTGEGYAHQAPVSSCGARLP
jgi:CubicO group peptidase (beta-lactamase class C family)